MKKQLFFALLILSRFVSAQDGQVDLTFGNNGVRFDAPGTPYIQTTNDGKVFLMINNQIKKLTNNGALDTTFGNMGVFSNPNTYRSISLYPNGKLLTQEALNLYQSRVVRLNSDGSIDTTFGTSANNSVDFSNSGCSPCIYNPTVTLSNNNSNDTFFIVANDDYYMGSRGVVILKSETGTTNFIISPVYTPAVTGGTGIHITTSARKILKSSDGNYFVGGEAVRINNNSGVSHREGSKAFVTKYYSQGSLINSFIFTASQGSSSGSNGGVDYYLDAQDNVYTLAVDNKYNNGQSLYYYRIYKTDKFGNLDYNFGSSNFSGYLNVSTAFSSITAYKTNFQRMLVQPDGKILLIGNTTYVDSSTTQNKEIMLARFNTNGTLDNTFGTNGFVIYDIDPTANEYLTNVGTNSNMTEIYISAVINATTTSPSKTAIVKFKNNSVLSAEEVITQQDLLCYPNPVKDILNLSYNKKIISVTIYNAVGQKLFTEEINAKDAKIDTSNLARGTYWVKAICDNEVKTTKIIKK
ncbi:T9SS type A sorting domain-containing protein [Chryseobacterium gambrini]|uniref:Delta-60 repeat domain-containing protein/Por secretion system C-terminal sorting domain-containing protein n=1 Tax=Chryseobacterium gambrini TaxID=373672 RepID=A0A1N7LBC8_9FLAO|nr:T9SS type A sorting domain-containing protein [Chryseobacterium gambrini]SIS71128.1 delta-60 repeat domain-containing protein/Por secretion system C-terminal sorting domain-containing protein [Chryseobacterium gambrini]